MPWDWQRSLRHGPALSWQPQWPETLLPVMRLPHGLSPERQHFYFLLNLPKRSKGYSPPTDRETHVLRATKAGTFTVFDLLAFGKHLGLLRVPFWVEMRQHMSLPGGPGWGAALQWGPAMVGSTTVQSREAGFLPPRSHMGRTHLQAVATAGPGAEPTTPLTPASLWERGCGCARVGWRGSSVTLLWTPTVLVPLSIPALNSLNYDCLSLCLPIGLWAPWEQRLHLFISIPGRQYSWLAQRNCSVNAYWTNGGETWLPQVDCLPGPYHNLLSSIRRQGPMLLPAHGPFLTACWSLALWPVPREGLAPGDRGKESIDRAMWMSTTSRFGGGERMAWIIVSRMWRGTVWVTHSSCFHLKLISKYHYKWTLNLKQNSMETNHSESF